MTLTIKSTIQLTSGYSMPLLGFGVYQNYNTKPSVLEALQAGYRHVDSAQAYKNEGAVGEAVRDSGIPREELFITTKCVSKTHGYDSTLKGVDESLARFGFDYIDLFLIHDPFSGTERRLNTYRALLDAQKAGKIRTVGVSNYGIKHLEEIKTAGLPMPAVNQIEVRLSSCYTRKIIMSFSHTAPSSVSAAPNRGVCRAHSVVVQAYSPIIRGQMNHLAIQAVANKYGRDPAQILIRWSLQNGFVPLPKSATPSRIRSNAAVYGFELGHEDMEQLDALDLGKAGAVSWNPVDAT